MDAGGANWAWLGFALMTAVSWGCYGVFLHTGQMAMAAMETALTPISGAHQDRPCAGPDRSLKIAKRVADQRHARQTNTEVFTYLMKQSGFRLATIAAFVRAMRAVNNKLNSPALGLNQLMKLAMHFVERGDREKAACDPRLITGNSNGKAGQRKRGNCRDAARERQPLFGRLNESIRVLVDHAVAIKNDKLWVFVPARHD